MDAEPPDRYARLVLITAAGVVLGSLEPFPVATPWWQDIAPVVRGARQHHRVEVVVLRMLDAARKSPHGGLVTYLAQVDAPVATEPWHGTLDDHPLRHAYARVNGPAADLAWADGILAAHGLARSAAEQIRTWNLSSLWRIETTGRNLWLKVVPPFFAHEGALLERLAGAPVPALLGREGGRMLLEELPGEDQYDAPLPRLPRMVSLAVALQAAWIERADELLELGLADFRGSRLAAAIAELVERSARELSATDHATLVDFAASLPERMAAVTGCGIPDTLVHGDLHPGNFRGDESTLWLLDWGDSGVGHPLLDQLAFLERVPQQAVEGLRAYWNQVWRTHLPDCDPERALHLLAPVAAARSALIYRRFLDAIEPSEQPYHRADPAFWLARCAELVRA